MTKINDLMTRLGDIPMTHPADAEKAVRAKSRDFFWYSPILKDKLEHVMADLVVTPRNETDVNATLAACYALDIPVTPRGGGTGNYGQAMPLAGGVVLDLSRMTAIKELRDGVVVAETGALIGDIDQCARAELGQELRMHPSTRETASIGGFIAGGSGGVGSIQWGMLYEAGNIRRLRVVTMEATPRVLDLTGEDIQKVHHAYGSTGVITEVEMPLEPAPDWVDLMICFPSWTLALDAGQRIASDLSTRLKLLSAIQAPAPQDYFKRHAKFLRPEENLLNIMAAPESVEAVIKLAGGRVALRSDRASEEALKGLPHLYHLAWNHTTLRGLRLDPAITYLQIGFPAGKEIETCQLIETRYSDEMIGHVEFTRSAGVPRMSGLPMIRHHSNKRLQALMEELEEMGCVVWNPHVYTLEEGDRRNADPQQLALKQAHDPKGLLNPGKMIAWEQPDYQFDLTRTYAYAGLQPKPQE